MPPGVSHYVDSVSTGRLRPASEGRIRTPPERGQRTMLMLEAEGVAFILDRIVLDRFAPSVAVA